MIKSYLNRKGEGMDIKLMLHELHYKR